MSDTPGADRPKTLNAERRAPRSGDGERGAVLILAALLMVALTGFVALVVDIANTTQERRQAQNSADAASLAGAQDLPDLDAVVASVKEYAQANYDIPAAAWPGCSDPEPLALTPDDGHNCISVNSELTQVRVRLPNHTVDTFFGGVLGTSSFQVSASAIAEIQEEGGDYVLPVAVPPNEAGRLCIIESGDNVPECAERTSGKFRDIRSPRLNNFIPRNQNPGGHSLRINLSVGLDHELDIYSGSPAVCDGQFQGQSRCDIDNVNTSETANHIQWGTGNPVDETTEGLVTGRSINMAGGGNQFFKGRLTRPDLTEQNRNDPNPSGGPGTPHTTAVGTTINGRHLAYWMEGWAREMFYGTGFTASEPVSENGGSYNANGGDDRLHCFLQWYRFANNPDATTTVVCDDGQTITRPVGRTTWRGMFDEGIVVDPRFGVIPGVNANVPGGSDASPIENFRAGFIYWLYEQGQGNNRKVHAADAWVFDVALIGPPDQTPGEFFDNLKTRSIRLAK